MTEQHKKQVNERAQAYDKSYFTWVYQQGHKDPKDHFVAGAEYYDSLDKWISVESGELPEVGAKVAIIFYYDFYIYDLKTGTNQMKRHYKTLNITPLATNNTT